MKKRLLMNLQLFAEDPEGNPPTPAAGNPPQAAPEIDYDKLAQIVQGKQSATEDSVLRGFFKQQGLSKEDAERAIADFKEKQKANDPNNKVAELTAELETYKNEKILAKKHVNADDYDYVSYKANQLVKEKNMSFEKALDSFLKENPRYAGQGTYRVSTGTPAGGNGATQTKNEQINDLIRNAIRRK